MGLKTLDLKSWFQTFKLFFHISIFFFKVIMTFQYGYQARRQVNTIKMKAVLELRTGQRLSSKANKTAGTFRFLALAVITSGIIIAF